MNKRKAIFPGSFDPFTVGHYDVVKRALPLFDEIVIAVGSNSTKTYLFDEDKRVSLIADAFSGDARVKVITYKGLTVDLCREQQAGSILRGLRNSTDFDFEQAIAQMNKNMNPGIETVFFLTSPETSAVSSTIVREIFRNGGDISSFLPPGVKL